MIISPGRWHLACGSDAERAFESICGASRKPLKLFQKVSINTRRVEFTAEGSFLKRVSRFFKVVVLLYDLKGPAKLLILFPWAVFGAILGRIVVTCEIDTASTISIDKVSTYLSQLKSSGFGSAETTLSQAMTELRIDSPVADRIREIFDLASREYGLPISQHNFDLACHVKLVKLADNDGSAIDVQNSSILEVLLALAIFYDVKFRLSVTIAAILVLPTNIIYNDTSSCMFMRKGCSVFIDTTCRFKEISKSVCEILDDAAQKEFAVDGGKTIHMYAISGSMQCFLLGKSQEEPTTPLTLGT